MQKALIYCRVSSVKQKDEGHGLDSQEHRCRVYAEQNNYEVEKVFRDSASGGGDFMRRPSMVALLDYLDRKAHGNYVVIFDDLKRFARDTVFHWKLRKEFNAREAEIKCINFKFEDTPEGEFIETILASHSQLERQQNRRQVIQKTKARLERGYACFALPVGYRYQQDPIHGKVAVLDESKATIIKEALEGYVSGRFTEKIDILDFLQKKDLNNGKKVYFETVKRFLNNTNFYSGYIEYLPWEVNSTKGHHKELISLATARKIQEKLSGKVKTFKKRLINPEFPLRGFVLCSECLGPMTGSSSTGRGGKKHPYYKCNTKGCKVLTKSLKRDEVEVRFTELLKRIKPNPNVMSGTKAVFKDLWDKKQKEWNQEQNTLSRQLQDLLRQKERLIDLVTKAEAVSLVRAYEERISNLNKEEMVLRESIGSFEESGHDIETALDIVFSFLENPLEQWTKGDVHSKKLVLRLVFQERLAYNRKSGFETAVLSLPLRVFSLSEASNSSLVDHAGLEPATSPMPWVRSTR